MAASLNPLRLTGASLPPNLLLAAKLSSTGILACGGTGILAGQNPALLAMALVSTLALLLNRWPRLSCLALGLAQLAGRLWIPGAILVLIALKPGFLFRRLPPVVLWGHLILQSVLLALGGARFTMLFFALTAVGLLFVDWPCQRLIVIYDGDCGFCRSAKKWVERLDLDRLFDWQAFQTGVAARFGIPQAAVEERVHLVTAGKIYSGFAAYKMMALLNPISYLAVVALLAALPQSLAMVRLALVGLLLLLFSPLFAPAGEAAYELVARRRHRLSAQPNCKVS